MNRQLNRLALVAVLMLVALIVATTYWQAWAAGSLAAKQDNAVELVSQFQVARGLIFASNGKTVLAADRRVKRNGQSFYFRRYPSHGLAAQTLGYSTSALSQTGLELSLNDFLTGSTTNLSNAIQRTLDRLGGGTVYGDNVTLTVTREGALLLDETGVTLETLPSVLRSKVGGRDGTVRDTNIVVAVDDAAPSGIVVQAMLKAREAGAERFLFAVAPK